MSARREYGSMALFASAEDLLRAAAHLRAMDFTSLEAYAPHVVEGWDEALQLPRSRMPAAMFGAGLCGGVGMLALQYYSAVIDYPVHVAGRPVALTRTEFELLAYLVERAGRAVSRERLAESALRLADRSDTRTVDAHISRLRHKLGEGGECVATVWGIGYRFGRSS